MSVAYRIKTLVILDIQYNTAQQKISGMLTYRLHPLKEHCMMMLLLDWERLRLVNLHQDHSLRENLIQELLMIQSIDLDMLSLHRVVVQMLDLQVTDLFYKNLTPQSDQQILKFKHTLVLDL